MRQKSLLLLLIGCNFVTALAWMLLADVDRSVTPPQGNASLDTDVRAPGGSAEPNLQLSPETTQVTIEVVSLEHFVTPPSKLNLFAQPNGTTLRGRVVAGVGAGFDAAASRRGPALIEIEYGDRLLLRYASLEGAKQLPLTLGARVMVRGVILDDQGQPLPTASVWFGERLAGGALRSFAVDDQGAFEADVPMGFGVPFVVRAKGYASKWRVISTPGAEIGGPAGWSSGELREMLEPATTVYLQIVARAIEIKRTRAYVLPVAEQISSGVSQWPFFAQLFNDGYAIDASGKAVITDLPQHGTVGFVARHPLAATGTPIAVNLSQSPTRATILMAFDSPNQQGFVVDEAGAGISTAWLFGRVPGQRLTTSGSARLMPPHLDLRGVWVARTDLSGAFFIGTPAASGAQIAVRALGFAGRDIPLKAAMENEIVLPRWHGGDASLLVEPPLLDVAWCIVSNLGGGVELTCEASASTALALPHCGRFEVRTRVEVHGQLPYERFVKSLSVTGLVNLPTAR